MSDLAGKVVLVTGGTRGIGCELVHAFAARGARVAFSGTSARSVADALGRFSSISQGATVRGFAADLADAAAPGRLVGEVVAAFGGIDVLVCNAGIVGSADPWTVQAEEWDQVLAVNLRAAFFCAREAAARIRVNCLAPADIETDMTAGWSDDLRQRLVAMTPLGRFGHADELSGAVLFLASGAASFVTGQTLNVNGGIYMG